MKKKKIVQVIAILLAVIMLIGLVASVLPLAFAASSDEIQEEIDELESQAVEIKEEIDKLQSQIDEKNAEMQGVIDQKTAIDLQMNLTREQIENTQAIISDYEVMIEAKRLELRKAKEKERGLLMGYISRIREMEENGRVSYLAILFEANSFSDLLDRIDWLEEISDADHRMMDVLSRNSSKIQAAEDELYAYQDELEQLKEDLTAQSEELKKQSENAQVLIDMLSNASEEIRKVQEEYDRQEEEIFALIADKQDEYNEAKNAEEEAMGIRNAEAAQGGQSVSYDPNQTFIRPVSGGWISSPYGWRMHPVYQEERFHSGVDIAVNQGTPIYASASGYVSLAAYDSSCGNWVMISHANGFATAYMHMTEYVVSSGQYVAQGQLIGYVGSTGCSTGPHLHFSMYYNGSYVNPADYVPV